MYSITIRNRTMDYVNSFNDLNSTNKQIVYKLDHFEKPSSIVFSAQNTTGPQFDSGLGKVQSSFQGSLKWVPNFLGNKTLKVSRSADHLTRTKAVYHLRTHCYENRVRDYRSKFLMDRNGACLVFNWKL